MSTTTAAIMLRDRLPNARQAGRIFSAIRKLKGRSRHWARVALAALPLALTAAALPQQPKPRCSIDYSANSTLTDLIKSRGFRFDGYDRLCPMLAARGLGLDIISDSGVLAERSYGFIFVALRRVKTAVVGSKGRSSVVVSRTVSTPEAENMMMEALSNALTEFAKAPEPFMDAVDAEEARLRRTLAASS